MELPEHGLPAEEIFAELEAMTAGDKDFAAGRTFGLVYPAGQDVAEVARRAHDRFVWYNALNPDVLPSLRRMQHEVLAHAAWMLSGGPVGADGVAGEPAGFMTSGGTESILLGVKSAKVRAKVERGEDRPNMVLPTSAHAAFDKACDYFGIEPRRIGVRDDYRADVDAMADAVDDHTVLIVGSAPQYPQGVIDPIPDIAAIAVDRGISCHVDACMGGFTLPFLERAGLVTGKPWDFRVPGVTTISADVHKYGFVPKGASIIMHRDKGSRRNQTFVFDGWLGGFYASSGILGTKPGGPIAASYATMRYLGTEGFVAKASAAFRARERLVAAIADIPELVVLGEPEVTLCAITGARDDVDAFALGDALSARGWHLDRQAPPDSLHASCAPVHDTGTVLEEFVTDLRASLDDIGATRAEDRSTNYAVME
jgi:glutamate/tyrosine decarboxylase-like PLP-dependent enzyme